MYQRVRLTTDVFGLAPVHRDRLYPENDYGVLRAVLQRRGGVGGERAGGMRATGANILRAPKIPCKICIHVTHLRNRKDVNIL